VKNAVGFLCGTNMRTFGEKTKYFFISCSEVTALFHLFR